MPGPGTLHSGTRHTGFAACLGGRVAAQITGDAEIIASPVISAAISCPGYLEHYIGKARFVMPALLHVGHFSRQSACHTPCKLTGKVCAMQAGSIALRGSRHSPHTTKGGFAISPLVVCGVSRVPFCMVSLRSVRSLAAPQFTPRPSSTPLVFA